MGRDDDGHPRVDGFYMGFQPVELFMMKEPFVFFSGVTSSELSVIKC